MKNIFLLFVLSLFLFGSCGGDKDNLPEDVDGDGYTIEEDCDDNDAKVNPGVIEVCGNLIDDNCNGEVDEGCNIGDLIKGGAVFYIAPIPVDLDGDGILDRGLVCALTDYESTVKWGCLNNDLPNVPNVDTYEYDVLLTSDGAKIGDGMDNTNNILIDCPTAPGALAAHSLGSKWFLPSILELNEMYVNKTALEAVPEFSSFSNSRYWSSTETDSEKAWNQDYRFGGSMDIIFEKDKSYTVRAVRAF